MDNVIVRVLDLPAAVPAVCALDSEGDYNVYINAKLSRDEALRAFEHEKRHILRNHFFRDVPAWFAEWEAER